jgi:predicted RNA-binding Zn-ribbon protein involved in translation (DUF1610 family)
LTLVTCVKCRKGLVWRGVCPECGEKRLTWSAGPVKLTTVPDGRLTMNDVQTQFHLGCEECSETLISRVDPDEVAAYLTSQGWRP